MLEFKPVSPPIHIHFPEAQTTCWYSHKARGFTPIFRISKLVILVVIHIILDIRIEHLTVVRRIIRNLLVVRFPGFISTVKAFERSLNISLIQ